MANVTNALSAYSQALERMKEAGPAQDQGAQAPGDSFANMVKGALKTSVQAGHEAERMQVQAIEGKADMREVVSAITNAETTLQTVVSVRDKVIGAYQQILRMPI